MPIIYGITTREVIVDLLRKADKTIKRRTRYDCGLTDKMDELKCGHFFFQSPDGQNCELFYELKRLGFYNAGYQAEYLWKVRKDNYIIEYVEGDIYVREIKQPQGVRPDLIVVDEVNN